MLTRKVIYIVFYQMGLKGEKDETGESTSQEFTKKWLWKTNR